MKLPIKEVVQAIRERLGPLALGHNERRVGYDDRIRVRSLSPGMGDGWDTIVVERPSWGGLDVRVKLREMPDLSQAIRISGSIPAGRAKDLLEAEVRMRAVIAFMRETLGRAVAGAVEFTLAKQILTPKEDR